jgi:hypothetical protein
MIADDLAFNIKPRDIISKRSLTIFEAAILKTFYSLRHDKRISSIPSLRKMFNNSKLETRKIPERILKNRKDILNCFRTDREKTDINIPKDNLDLSRIFDYGVHNEKTCALYIPSPSWFHESLSGNKIKSFAYLYCWCTFGQNGKISPE